MLSGILYSPLSIKDKFDEIMGDGTWFKICKVSDKIVSDHEKHRPLDNSEIKIIVDNLEKYVNLKLSNYEEKGYLNSEIIEHIRNNFYERYNVVANQFGFETKDINNRTI